MADDDIDNEDVLNALKQPAQFKTNQFFPQRPEGAVSDWIDSQGGKVKSGIEDILKHPESMIGPGNLTGIMAGPLAKTANMGNYRNAVDMILKGTASKENIFDKTGWFQRTGAGQLAHEISDKGMVAKPNPHKDTQGVASDFINHKSLFDAYPEAKDAPVHIDPKYGSESSAVFNYPQGGHITIGGKVDPKGLSQEQQGGIIHELQHWVQDKEGWDLGGGNPEAHEKLLRRAVSTRLPNLGPDDPKRQEIYNVLGALKGVGGNNFWSYPQSQMYVRNPAENEAMNVDMRHANDVFGKSRRIVDPNDYGTVSQVLRGKGIALDMTYGNPGDRASPNKYGMRKWGTNEPISPDVLDPATRELYDRLPTYHDWEGNPRHMVGDRKYPWKTEMFPSDKVYNYAGGLRRVIYGGR